VRQQENIEVELAETGWEGVDWDSSGSGQRQVADSCEHLQASFNAENFLTN